MALILPLSVADTLPHHIKDVALNPLLEREEIAVTEDDAELFGGEVTPSCRPQHAQDNEQIAVIVLYLRALDRIDDILQNQGVQGESLPQEADDFDIVNPFHIHPGDARAFQVQQAVVHRLKTLFLKRLLIISDQVDRNRFGRGLVRCAPGCRAACRP